MLRDALHHRRWEACRAVERCQAEIDMTLDQFKLRRRQQAGLGEQRARHLDLADIGQQADQSEFGQLCLRKTQVSPECDQVERDLDAMVIGVDVLITQPGHPHQGIGIGGHALDHLIDALLGGSDVGHLPDLDVVKDGLKYGFTSGKSLSGARQFGLEGAGIAIDDGRDADWQQVCEHLRQMFLS